MGINLGPICPACNGRATKIVNITTGIIECQQCRYEWNPLYKDDRSCAGCNSQICDIHKHACSIYNILQNNNMFAGASMFYDTLKKIYKLCTIKDSK